MRRPLDWYRRQTVERQKVYSLLGVIASGTLLLYCAGLSSFTLRNYLVENETNPTLTPILAIPGSPTPLATQLPTPTLPPTPTQLPIPSPTPTPEATETITATPEEGTPTATPIPPEFTPEPTLTPSPQGTPSASPTPT